MLLLPSFVHAQNIASRRFEIDAKRADVSYTSKDALPRGREFKRIDSTYYVGWMLEGTYKFEHAADYLGFKSASDQLSKALQLLEKDFKKELKTRTNDVYKYLSIMKYHRDWDYIAYHLITCYSNIDEPSKTWAVLQKCRAMDLQDELYTDTYNLMSWTVHRNRFYTKSKHSFLKNSIPENEQFANQLLDSSLIKIKRDAKTNQGLFNGDFEAQKIPGVWHYKAMLYSYQLNIEKGSYYYDKLKQTENFPANNYATFCALQANFRDAEKFYSISKTEDPGDKRMKESFYYSSILNEYKGENKIGIEELRKLIKANGSTPGFGWYNIALSREFCYDGQIDFASKYLQTASQFKEIHIGTTLGQSHYDFSVSLMNLIIKNKEIAYIKFTNPYWWLTIKDAMRITHLTLQKYGLQFLIINQFAENPERDQVIYKLFSTESTVSFDEIAQLLEGFSSSYFIERFSSEIKQDKRYAVKRYYKYMLAKFLLAKSETEQSKQYLESILNEILIDREYEKLLLARVYEHLAICYEKLGETSKINQCTEQIYALYPQLIPYTNLTLNMRLHIQGTSKGGEKIISYLKSSRIHWVSDKSQAMIDVYVNFSTSNKKEKLILSVTFKGKKINTKTEFQVPNNDIECSQILNSIFNIGS